MTTRLSAVSPSVPTRFKRIHPLRVAFAVRALQPSWRNLGQAAADPRKRGLLGGNPMLIRICHDDPEVTAPAKLRYDACVTVDEDFGGENEVGIQTMAGGEYAVTMHPENTATEDLLTDICAPLRWASLEVIDATVEDRSLQAARVRSHTQAGNGEGQQGMLFGPRRPPGRSRDGDLHRAYRSALWRRIHSKNDTQILWSARLQRLQA